MNSKTRPLLVLFLFLAAQLACTGPLSRPLPGQSGAGAPGPVYTLTSLPPFPTATRTPLPSPTATVTATPAPTRTPTKTTTAVGTLEPLPSKQPVSLTSAPRPRPIMPVVAHYLSTPPKLDGDWGEWKGLTDEYPANTVVWGESNWTGPADLSASYHLGWDEKFLYLAIKVRDDQYVENGSGANLFNGDSLELELDTQLMEDYTDAKLSDDDFQLGLSAGRPQPGMRQEAYLWTPNYLAGDKKDIQIEARRESGLYRVEAAIPWTIFEMKPVMNKHYGFAISVSDNDNGDSGVQQSMITNLPSRNPTNPTTWGDLQLVK